MEKWIASGDVEPAWEIWMDFWKAKGRIALRKQFQARQKAQVAYSGDSNRRSVTIDGRNNNPSCPANERTNHEIVYTKAGVSLHDNRFHLFNGREWHYLQSAVESPFKNPHRVSRRLEVSFAGHHPSDKVTSHYQGMDQK
ncbi:hypothetical protein GLAREA_11561 [Glarea lozoyensis ATCC 20868]|uniref:Uncharacterized protein n=1 Tax=Glarea lozoyensis (strain ATCC 20868 / MF5171) TaxID=1116229 RepID=S3CGE5_GLAL2|nr:uncharacterized protein GLAREA_11561 [Glarea lozoyensis ATCC 20868]EPE24980.1 hypothetical protein GLAREA_11561 [Glarea lozoyensis ATCC 20868]